MTSWLGNPDESGKTSGTDTTTPPTLDAIEPPGIPSPRGRSGRSHVLRALAAVQERERVLRAAEEMAQLGTWIWTVGSDVVIWSDQVHRIFGTDPAGSAATYDVYLAMIHPDDRDHVLSVIRDAGRLGGTYEVDHRVVRCDGRIVEVRGRGRAELDDAGRPTRLIGSVQDVTESRAVARELQRSRDLFAGVLDAATEQSIIATDPDGLITVFNAGAERMLGYRADDMVGTSPERLHDPDEIAARARELGVEPGFGVFLVNAAAGRPETRQWTYVTRDGRRLLASITVTAMHGPGGEVTGFIKVGTDVTERVQAQDALQHSERRFRDLFQYAPNGMMLFGIGGDNLGRFLQVNPALAKLTGYSEEQLLDMSMADLVAPGDLAAYHQRLQAFHARPILDAPADRHWVDAGGQELWVQISVSPGSSTADGAYVVGQVEDITARKQVEARLRHEALHDMLTGLPNRVLLMDRIEHALAVASRTDHVVGVLYLDLDGFKEVNDSAGHAVGDQALVHIGGQIRTVLRPADTVARLGGDEFVVVCEGLHSGDEATAVAGRILAAVRTPFLADGQRFILTCSIGISLSTASSRPAQLLQEADHAMYLAKRAGKARSQVGSDPAYVANSARAARVLRLTAELQHAVENDELIVYGQPIMDVTTGAVVAVESLLRWQHPVHGLLGPADFLDVAETGDLMLPIGRHVLRESCRMAATWVAVLGVEAPAVHVNISGRQLEAGSLHSEVVDALASYQLAPSQLILELTETNMPLIANSVKVDLEDLRNRGSRVAIDDLGTGYSSLTRITELAVDILKIDVSFVAGMQTDASCAAVVRGILSIGAALELQVIAEGVESVAQAEHLAAHGCSFAQGYLYSRPLPEDVLHSYLRKAPQVPVVAAPNGQARVAVSITNR